MTAKAIFVNNRDVPYADLIAAGKKLYETRSRNMLRALIGRRVAVVRTGCGSPEIIGFVNIDGADYFAHDSFENIRDLTMIPKNSKYDDGGNGKWCYKLSAAHALETPIPLPKNIIRHGRSWCEIPLFVHWEF